MEKKSLHIYKLDGQRNKVKFPNSDTPAKLGEYTYSAQRMAGTPTLTATLNYHVCLDDLWTGEEFVEFRGEKYYVGQIPTSSKDNKSIMYKHELQFVSERIVLENVYFMDVVTDGADTYHSNSTVVKFMGDIHEFVGRLNASMAKSGIGYSVVIDDDITSDSKLVSLDNVYLADTLQSIYTIYELPYYFVGKVIHIGYTEHVISTPFEYRKGLVSIKKTNANYKIINRVTGVGSSENIPFYYPNDDETGTIERCQNLMPSIYRKSGGMERFYNALNDTYKIPETNDYYWFKNQYSPNNVKEFKVDFSDIKPTIEDVKNASGQLFGEIADIAFDANDSDELGTGKGNNVFNGTDEYVHSYFYIKLHIYNGDYGFNLFEQGLEGSTAVINMTTGNCAACEFEIGVTYKGNEPKRAFNPVLVDAEGNLPAGDFEQKVTSNTSLYVPRQQDTSENEVWIAVKKDNTSFGIIMPNATNNYKPAIGDKFVITGIKMPKSLVLSAEKRLEDALIKYMSENNDEKFTFTMNFSRVFLAENSYLWNVLNENARVYIRYNNHEYLMYVNSYTCKADKNCLYDIAVELTDKLSANVSALRSTIAEIAGDIIGSKFGATNNYSDSFAKFARKFIRKDQPDETNFIVNFLKGLYSEYIRSPYIRSTNYASGPLGEGFLIKVDPKTGKSYIEVDELFVRIKAMFTELEIKKLSYAGGNYMFTAAGMKCVKVEEHEDFWRCYLLVDDGEIAVENPFKEGDQIRFREFNIKSGVYENVSNRYYWRLCVGIGEDYIDISKTDCDANSDAPQEGDSLVQLGNRTNQQRQNAITLSVYGDDAPSIHQYAGINSYSMAGKEVTVISPEGNKFLGDFFLKTGVNIMTQFEMLENLFRSEMENLRNEIQEKDNYLSNSAFASSTDKWKTTNDIRFFTVGNKFLYFNSNFYSEKKQVADIIKLSTRSVLRIKASGIKQANADLANKPKHLGSDGEGNETPPKFFVSFRVRVLDHGVLTIGFPGQGLYHTETLEPTDEFIQKEYSGTWDGTGDFEMKFTGDAYFYSLALTDNAFEEMYTKFSTKIEQTNEKIELLAKATSEMGNELRSSITATAEDISLVSNKTDKLGNTLTSMGIVIDGNNGNISQFVKKDGVISSINQASESVSIDASKINLNGAVTISSLDSSLSSTILNKADISALGALAYKSAVEAAELGSTIIIGGYLNTSYIKVNKIEAIEGTIAGFSINREGLYTHGGNANSSLLSPNKIILKKEYYDPSLTNVYARKECRLGSGAAEGETEGDMVAYFHRELTGGSFYNPAVKIESRVYSRDGVALDLKGALRVKGGVIEKGYFLNLSSTSENVIDLTFGTVYSLLNRWTSSNIYIPTHSDVCKQLGIGTSDYFCIRLVVAIDKGSTYAVFVTSQKHKGVPVADAGIFVDNNGNEWSNSIRKMEKGDITVFYLTYNYFSGYYIHLAHLAD